MQWEESMLWPTNSPSRHGRTPLTMSQSNTTLLLRWGVDTWDSTVPLSLKRANHPSPPKEPPLWDWKIERKITRNDDKIIGTMIHRFCCYSFGNHLIKTWTIYNWNRYWSTQSIYNSKVTTTLSKSQFTHWKKCDARDCIQQTSWFYIPMIEH